MYWAVVQMVSVTQFHRGIWHNSSSRLHAMVTTRKQALCVNHSEMLAWMNFTDLSCVIVRKKVMQHVPHCGNERHWSDRIWFEVFYNRAEATPANRAQQISRGESIESYEYESFSLWIMWLTRRRACLYTAEAALIFLLVDEYTPCAAN